MRFILLVFSLSISLSVYTQQQNGYMKFYYPNGKISSEGYMVNNKPDGYWKTYYPTETLKSEGKRFNYLLDSIWVFYTETGDTIEKITYLAGKKNGYYYKYSTISELNKTYSNVIVSKELYINDLKEGISYYYYPDGKIKETIIFKNNKKHGEAREYDNTGKLITINQFFNNYLTEKQTINRLQNNIPVGVWRDYNANGTIKAEKNYKNGDLHGYSNEYDENGKLISRQLFNEGKILNLAKEDTLDIKEVITWFDNKKVKTRTYFKDNIPVGIHREYDLNGNVIKAFIYDNNGKLTGTGIIRDDGSREGKFTYFYNSGLVKSEGEYFNNRQNGKWNFYYESHFSEQVGYFSNGYFNGEWKWFYPDSSLLRIENFINGKRNGLYIELYPKGDTLTRGSYVNDVKTGLWYFNYGDVNETGLYKNDLKEGIWKSYYANGNLFSKGNFIQGNPDGKYYFYYDNKIIKEEQYYVNGIRERTWKKFNPDGTLFLSILYQNDMETRVNGVKLEIVK